MSPSTPAQEPQGCLHAPECQNCTKLEAMYSRELRRWVDAMTENRTLREERDRMEHERNDFWAKWMNTLEQFQSAREERDKLQAEVMARLNDQLAGLREIDRLREERDKALQALREAERELRQERGFKALLANGMPPTGNPDFDEVLATHPIAAMIQRGWLTGVTGFDDLPMLEAAICRFYEVSTIAEAINPPWPGLSKPAGLQEEKP
jgi:hypothetical protein